ncbi:hypothetical protein FHU36_005988 [Nonomuraea muscovyensis]|uniref:Uncharacterized protein n=1 Tax=Nonomuraea muscovyensis TaxID=1124761 RepID=A0A7X0EZ54_9ACTN|nr:hypothetical protein [Nonomuraea muscovyensis]
MSVRLYVGYGDALAVARRSVDAVKSGEPTAGRK